MAIKTTKFGTLDTTRAPVTARQSDGTYALDFDIGGKSYTFVPSDIVNKGGWTQGSTNYLLPYFTDKANIARFVYNSDQVDLASEPGIAKYLENQGRASTGYLLPSDKVGFDGKVDTVPATQMGSLAGLRMDDAGNVVYGVSGGHGKSYMTADFQVHDPYTEVRHKFFGGKLGSLLVSANELIRDIGPIGPALLNMWVPGLGTAMSVGQAIGSGADLEKVIKNVGLAYAGQAIGSAANMSIDQALADLGKSGDVIGNVVGQTAGNLIASGGKADPMSLLQAGALGEAVSNLATEIPGYNVLSDASKRAVNNAIADVLQDRDPTASLLSLAKSAGETAMATSMGALTEEQSAKAQAELQQQLASYETPTPAPAPTPGTTPDYPVQEMQITPENLQSYQDTLSDNFQGSQWQAGEGGDYILTGDDGSTITMHADGTTTATEAPPENLLDAIGESATEAQPTQTGTQPTRTTATSGETQPTRTVAQTAAEASPTGLSVDQLASLYSLFEGEGAGAAPQATDQAAAGTQAYKPAEGVSYLDELGEKPRYLDGLDPETLQIMQQLGIDPAELLARQEAEGGDDHGDDHGEEGVDVLEARGRLEGYKTPDGVKRGLSPGAFGLAGTDVAKAYRAAMADRSLEYGNAYKQPIDMYNQAYLKKLAPAAEAALNESWDQIVRGKGISLAGSDAPIRRDMANEALAYVPTSSIATSKYYEGAGLAPQLIAMVGENPQLLNDPDALAMVMSHELAHRTPQRSVEGPSLSPVADAAKQTAGFTGAGAGRTQADLYKGLAGARDYLANQYGYKGVYDYKQELPLEELLADIGGWSQQSGVNITKDPYILKNVLNTPETLAVYNVMHPNRSVQPDPFFPPVGTITAEDFLPYEPPVGWAYKNMDSDQFKAMLKKRLAGMFGQ